MLERHVPRRDGRRRPRRAGARATCSSSRPGSSIDRSPTPARPTRCCSSGRRRSNMATIGGRGRARGAAATIAGRDRSAAHPGAQDVQALRRRPVPALRVGPLVRRPLAGRHAARERRSLVAQGCSRRRSHGAWRCSRLGGQDRDEPRPGPLPRRRADGGAPRAVHRGGRRSRRAAARPAPKCSVDRSIDRWVWYAGWADKITQVLGTVNPVGAPYFNFTHPRGDRRRRHRRAGELVAARPGFACRAGRGRRQRGRGARVGVAAAARGDAGRGARHVRCAAAA